MCRRAPAEPEYSCEYGSPKFFAIAGFGGILSCGITHTAIVPLDLVKCRIQTNADKYKGIFNGFKVGPAPVSVVVSYPQIFPDEERGLDCGPVTVD